MQSAVRLFVPALSLFSLLSCGGDSGDLNDPSSSATYHESFDFDGLLLLASTPMQGNYFNLVDPTTGLASSLRYDGYIATLAVSPDLKRVAYVGHDDAIYVMEPELRNGRPEMREVASWPSAGNALIKLRFSPDGTRIFVENAWFNIETRASTSCASATSNNIAEPIPGGTRVLCVANGTIVEDDGSVVVQAPVLEPAGLSADGQFYGRFTSTVTGVLHRDPPEEDRDGTTLDQYIVHVDLPNGTGTASRVGVNGRYVEQDLSGPGTIVYRILTSDSTPEPTQTYDPRVVFSDHDYTRAPSQWQLSIFSLLADGDGRAWGPLGATADSKRMLYTINTWEVPFSAQDAYETVVDVGIMEVNQDGTARYVSSERTAPRAGTQQLQSVTGDPRGAAYEHPHIQDLGHGDWLVQAGSREAGDTSVMGFIDEQAVVMRGIQGVTPDGLWLYGAFVNGTDDGVCVSAVRSNDVKCIRRTSNGNPIAVVGVGVRADASAAPRLFGSSQTAALPGAVITLHGAHFGEQNASSTITLDETPVPSTDVVSWTDNKITFRMSEALPLTGRLRVHTANGVAGEGAELWISRTTRASTPFDAFDRGTIALGQGLNAVDFPAGIASRNGMYHPDVQFEDGRRAVVMTDAEPGPFELDFAIDSYEVTAHFVMEDRISTDSAWQPMDINFLNPTTESFQFSRLGDRIIDHVGRRSPELANRLTYRSIASTSNVTVGANVFGLPDTWRNVDGGAWTLNRFNETGPATHNVNFFSSWTIGTHPASLVGALLPEYATTPASTTRNTINHIAAAGNVVILTGSAADGNPGAGFVLSADTGVTFDWGHNVATELSSTTTELAEPIAVEASGGTFFLVAEQNTGNKRVLRFHAISTTGVLTTNVAALPGSAPALTTHRNTHALVHATNGGLSMMHFLEGSAAFVTDFDASVSGTRTLTAIPNDAAMGHVTCVYEDDSTHDLYAVLDDGTVHRSTLATRWAAWAPFDLGIELPVNIAVRPVALTKIDGRWLVLAYTFDAANPANESPLMRSAVFLGPR